MPEPYLQILAAKPIPMEHWKELSAGAWSNRPHYETTMDYHVRQLSQAMAQQFEELGTIDPDAPVEVSGPDVPGDLDDVDPKLPPLSQTEVRALLVQFLRAERGEIVAGAQINDLHWLIICGVYAPRRERYTSLRELVNIGELTQLTDGTLYVPSGLRWPLSISKMGAAALEELAHVQRHIPTFWKARKVLAAWMRALPVIGDLLRKKVGA